VCIATRFVSSLALGFHVTWCENASGEQVFVDIPHSRPSVCTISIRFRRLSLPHDTQSRLFRNWNQPVKAFCDLSVLFDRDAFRTHYIKSIESRSSTWKSLNLDIAFTYFSETCYILLHITNNNWSIWWDVISFQCHDNTTQFL